MSASQEPVEHHEFQPAFHDERDRSSTLFDLRWVIGALFTLYGVILVIASFWISDAKSGGLDINLWLGAGMLTLGLFFLSWARLRPLQHLQAPSVLAQAEQAAAEQAGAEQDRPGPGSSG